jgi:molybdopterin/thiamine biosynthesis adenylyltransferase/predicted RNA-binding Zn-ribbon protein involved in translation (DUF1610 family)
VQQKSIQVTQTESERYASLRQIAWWRQQRLAGAHVMVIGAGALGNEVLKNLALLGVGHIVIVDHDTIELSNLARSVLFRAEDVQRPKVEVAAERIQQINPQVAVAPLYKDLLDVGLGVFRQMDIIMSCLDNREARRRVNLACWRVGRPWIDGALDTLDGLVRIFYPQIEGTACYECILSAADYALLEQNYSCPAGPSIPQGHYPTTPTAASIIAAMQVQEAVKMLHGKTVSIGHCTYYSGQTMRMTTVQYSPREDCPAHDHYEHIIELPLCAATTSIRELQALLQTRLGQAVTVLRKQIIVSTLHCPQCGSHVVTSQSYATLTPAELRCPTCGQVRSITVASTLADDEESLPLSQQGIPPLDILTVRSSTKEYYVELSGDVIPYRFMEVPVHEHEASPKTSPE